MANFEDIPPIRGGDEWTPRSSSKKNKRTRASELFPEVQEGMQERAPKLRRFTKAEQRSPYHSSDEDSVEQSALRKRSKGEGGIEEDKGRRVRRRLPKKEEGPVVDQLGGLVGPDRVFFKECVYSLKHNRQIFPQLVADPRMNPIVAKRLLQLPMIEDATPQALRRLAERMSGSLQEGVKFLSQSEWGTQRVGLLATLCVTADSFQEQEALTRAVADYLVQTGNLQARRSFVEYLPETIRPTLTLTARSREELDDVIAKLTDLTLGRKDL
jgi:hypothetical protein